MNFVKEEEMPVMMVKGGVIGMKGWQVNKEVVTRIQNVLDQVPGFETEKVETIENGDIAIVFREMVSPHLINEVNLHIRSVMTA